MNAPQTSLNSLDANSLGARTASSAMTRELIAFEVGGELFGLDVAAVLEIRAWAPLTRMPGVPHYVAGLVNLRGAILPVIDLAARLGWPATEASERHAIMVALIGGQMCGLIVESVSDLIPIGETLLHPPPWGDPEITSLIEGLAPVDERMVLVLDLASLAEGVTLREIC